MKRARAKSLKRIRSIRRMLGSASLALLAPLPPSNAAAGTDSPAFTPAPPASAVIDLSFLSNVRVMTATNSTVALPLNSPPIGGFVPQVVYGLTDEQDSDDYAITKSVPGGTQLPGPSPKYFVATVDSGSQSHIVSYADAQAFDLDGHGLGGSNPIDLVGASGTETGIVTNPLGVYVTGFGNATVNNGILGVATTTFPAGHYNASVVTTMSDSALPSVIGAPMMAQYRTVIRNTQPMHLSVGTQTFRSPQVDFQTPSATVPTGYSKISLSRVPQGFLSVVTTPPSYNLGFGPTGDDPFAPTSWFSLMASVNGAGNGGSFNGSQFLFDTGAQVSVVSEQTAQSVGYYTGGPNPSTPDFYVDVEGVGGTTTQVPGFYLPSLTVTMSNAPNITWTHVPVLVLDLPDPAGQSDSLAGVLGMNLFTDRDLVLNGIYPVSDSGTNSFAAISTQWQWATNGSGTWGNSANWTLALPSGIDMQANFYGSITSAATITVDGTGYTVGTINFDNANRYTINGPGRLTLQVSGDQAQINVSTGSHTINAPMTLASDTTVTVWPAASRLTITSDVTAAGVALTKDGLGVLEMKDVRAGTLNVSKGTVVITANGTSTGTSRVSALTIESGSQLDLTNNSMIIDYSAVGSLVNDVRQHLQAGRLTSSSASAMRRLGYGDNALLHKSSFGGQSVTDNALLISFTFVGDANLDGRVDATDLAALAGHWQTGSVWTGGDFDYNGLVNILDLSLLAGNWQQGVASPALGGSLADAMASLSFVPEPQAIAGLSLLGLAMTRRQRHRHRQRLRKGVQRL